VGEHHYETENIFTSATLFGLCATHIFVCYPAVHSFKSTNSCLYHITAELLKYEFDEKKDVLIPTTQTMQSERAQIVHIEFSYDYTNPQVSQTRLKSIVSD